MKLNKVAAGLVVLGIAAIGCGKGLSGTYTVSEVLSGGSLSSQCANSQLNLSVSEDGKALNGSGSNTCFSSENLTGQDDGSGHINNAVLTLTLAQQNQSGYGYGGGYYGGGYGSYPYYGGNPGYGSTNPSTTCTYTGSLNFSSNQLSGTLNLQQNTQSQYSSSYSSNGACPNTITLNGSMSG